MEQKRDIELNISDYLNGLLTSEQEKEFMEWVHSSKENTDLFAEYCARWELSMIPLSDKKFRVEDNWRKLVVRIEPRIRYKRFLREYGKIAAVFVVAFLLGVAVMKITPPKSIMQVQASWIINETPLGSKSSIILPDGSEVWMNAGSKIRYANTFNLNDRKLFLEGEAYFHVKTNSQKPFEVNASGITIQATGTEFNVRAYGDENFVETTLVEGKVSVNGMHSTRKETVYMKPGQNLTLFIAEDSAPVQSLKNETADEQSGNKPNKPVIDKRLDSNVETAVYTSWKDDEWIIQKEKFSSLAVKLERRYDVEIAISDQKIMDFAYTGKLKDETLEQVMKVIGQTSPINYNINGKKVKVWYNQDYNKNRKN